MKCPCEECLVRIPCRTKVVKKNKSGNPDWNEDFLIIEFLEKCPYIIKYFGVNRFGGINHTHEQISKLCDIFRVTDRRFVWIGSTIGIYE